MHHEHYAGDQKASRRRPIVIGAAGLVAAAALGGVALAQNLTSDNGDVAAISTPSHAAPTLTTAASTSTAQADSVPAETTEPAATTSSKPAPEVSREIVAARSKAAADGVPLRRGIGSKSLDEAKDVQVTNVGTPQSPGGSIKVVAARTDLTGYQELSWAGDEGEKVGDANCTQNFRLSNDTKPAKRPTLLLCWRTSAAKSVYTVAISAKPNPSKQASVAELDKAWNKLS